MAAVYRRRRVVVATLAVVLLFALSQVAVPVGMAVARAYGLVSPPMPTLEVVPETGVIVVQPGDTLSTIARRMAPRGDITPLVAKLSDLHGPGPLMPGDRIDVSGLVS